MFLACIASFGRDSSRSQFRFVASQQFRHLCQPAVDVLHHRIVEVRPLNACQCPGGLPFLRFGGVVGKIEVTIPVKGNIIRSEQVSNDMYVSIDLVEEVIERQLRKYKNKIVDKQQAAANFQKAYLDKDYDEDEEVKIIRTKKFGIKPMYPEDACVQMELLGHNFFVFYNAETEQVNVVYKRKGNTYGLIEPEF